MAQARPRSLPHEILRETFQFMSAETLTKSRQVCQTWRRLADSSDSWQNLCSKLWVDKDNHPLEQWVKVDAEDDSVEDTIRDRIEYLVLMMNVFEIGERRKNETVLNVIAYINLCGTKKHAAPISHHMRYQQIFLENLYLAYDSETGRSKLAETIVSNQRTPIQVTDSDLERYRVQGRLLDWRQSYIASVIDSTRCRLTYEELRLSGEWIVHAPKLGMLTTMRFISGGHEVITNISYHDNPGRIGLSSITVIADAVMRATVIRSPHDWGWVCLVRGSNFRFVSIDRKKGFLNLTSKLERSAEKRRRNGREIIQQLYTPLKDIPINGLYVM